MIKYFKSCALLILLNSPFAIHADEPMAIFLTWEADPLRTMVVDWHTESTENPGILHYKAMIANSDSWETETSELLPFPFAERSIHRISLSGLKPGTTYKFKIEGFDRTYNFRTMPENAMDPVVVALGGDTLHYPRKMMDNMNLQVLKYDPDFIVWGGDLAYADGDPERVERWFDWFDSIRETLITDDGRVIPIVVGIGNHEVRGGWIWRTSKEGESGYQQTNEYRQDIAPFFYQLFAFPGQPGYGVLDFGSYLSLIILDTDHSNPIIGRQTKWLEKVLKDRQDKILHQIPVYHAPGYTSARDFNQRSSRGVREFWMPLFEQYGVNFAFENHDHTYKRTLPMKNGEPHEKGIVYLGDGAWGVNTRPVLPVEKYGYMAKVASERHAIIMTLQGRHISIEVFSEDGEIIDRFPETPGITPGRIQVPKE